MKSLLDTSESKRGGEETLRLHFNSHQDALDFADHVVQDANRSLATHNFNFTQRYIQHDVDIVVRADFGIEDRSRDGVYDFVIFRSPDSVGRYENWRERGRSGDGAFGQYASEDQRRETSSHRNDKGVLEIGRAHV